MELFSCIHVDGMHQAFFAAFDDHCVVHTVYTKRCLGIAVIKLWVIFAKGSLRDPALYIFWILIPTKSYNFHYGWILLASCCHHHHHCIQVTISVILVIQMHSPEPSFDSWRP